MTDTATDPEIGAARRRAAHWNSAYETKGAEGVSWYQSAAQPSLGLITEHAPDPGSAIIDVGGGSSHLVDALLRAGYTDVTVLDVSARALHDARDRLSDSAERATWIEADLLAWVPQQRYDVWHDRAVFHFLTDAHDRGHYVDLVSASVEPGGHLVVGAFAADGPEACSGLPVVRYAAQVLAAEFARAFELRSHQRVDHVTPWGSVQPFTWVVLARRHS